MMKKCRTYIGLVLLLAGCVRAPLPEEKVPIVCTASAAGETRGAGVTTTSSLQGSGLGLFAWHTYEGTSFGNSATTYLTNRQFTYDEGTEIWRGSAWWIPGSWLSFFAYAPYMVDVNTGALRFPSSDYTSGYPRLQYTPASSAASQVDLCLSSPVLDRSASVDGGVVPLVFTHVLSRLRLQARYTGSTAQIADLATKGRSVRLISISLSNIVGTNKLSYNSSSYLWDTPAPASYSTTYALSVAGGSMTSVALPPEPAAFSSAFLNAGDGYLYLLPQNLSAAASPAMLTVTFGIFDSGGALVGESIEVEFAIGDLVQHLWAAGYEMTYSITIDLLGHYAVEADVTFDCNAGRFLSPGDVDFNASEAGSFLGGAFMMGSTSAGDFGTIGIPIDGSSAGSFVQ